MTAPPKERFQFEPERHRQSLRAIVDEIARLEAVDDGRVQGILRRHPPPQGGFFSKAQVLAGFRWLERHEALPLDERQFVERIRMKPIRTLSGVAPVTVLTEPHPCPGRCVFCPSDVRMPKSYISSEPGARRAAEHRFDPWDQTTARLRALYRTGHDVDKVELIVLGGTWCSYPRDYRRWFVRRCFDALNQFEGEAEVRWCSEGLDWRRFDDVDAAEVRGAYNRTVRALSQGRGAERRASLEQVADAQRRNERARARCVGLVVETRPDRVDAASLLELRRLGVTKVQIGFQSLDDRILALNRRGHDVAATRRAVRLLREAGFKIHAHWMPNLLGATPESDSLDYRRLFSDPDFRPDELKIYPCSLVETAELMDFWRRGEWRPYDEGELVELLVDCLRETPRYCRLTRIVRDIPGTEIVTGSRVTNLREVAEASARERGVICRDVRAREVRSRPVPAETVELLQTSYPTSVGRECFLELVTGEDRLAGFLRLSLPDRPVFAAEIARSAMIREVHVYGRVAELGGDAGPAQHRGFGRRLVERAAQIAAGEGYRDLAVISAVGTRAYYRRLGFDDGELYQHREVAPEATGSGADRPGRSR